MDLTKGTSDIPPSLPPITLPDHLKSDAVVKDAIQTAAASDADRAANWRRELEKAWPVTISDLYVSTPQEYAELEGQVVAELEAEGFTCTRITPDNYRPPRGDVHMFDKHGNPLVPNVRVIIGGQDMVAWGWQIAKPGEPWADTDKLLSLDGLRTALELHKRDKAIEKELAERIKRRQQDRERRAAEEREAWENSPEGRLAKSEAENAELRARIERLERLVNADA